MGIVTELKSKLSEKNDMAVVIDQLSNDEESSDKELLQFLSKETSFKKEDLEKMIKKLRPTFLKTPVMTDKEAKDLISKFL